MFLAKQKASVSPTPPPRLHTYNHTALTTIWHNLRKKTRQQRPAQRYKFLSSDWTCISLEKVPSSLHQQEMWKLWNFKLMQSQRPRETIFVSILEYVEGCHVQNVLNIKKPWRIPKTTCTFHQVIYFVSQSGENKSMDRFCCFVRAGLQHELRWRSG